MIRRRNLWYAVRSSAKGLLTESPRYAPVQQGFHHLGLYHAQLQGERGSLHIVQLRGDFSVLERDRGYVWHYFNPPSVRVTFGFT